MRSLRTIYSNSERLKQFLKQNIVLVVTGDVETNQKYSIKLKDKNQI